MDDLPIRGGPRHREDRRTRLLVSAFGLGEPYNAEARAPEAARAEAQGGARAQAGQAPEAGQASPARARVRPMPEPFPRTRLATMAASVPPWRTLPRAELSSRGMEHEPEHV